MKKARIRAMVAGSVLAGSAVSASAAVPTELTGALTTFGTDAATVLGAGLAVAVTVYSFLAIWKLGKRIIGKASS